MLSRRDNPLTRSVLVATLAYCPTIVFDASVKRFQYARRAVVQSAAHISNMRPGDLGEHDSLMLFNA